MIDAASLISHAHQILPKADIAGLSNRYRGKVRDNYDLPDGRRIPVTTDRISAFDRPLAVVPFKGQVLTEGSRRPESLARRWRPEWSR